jgi:hypothetical protein
MPRLAWVLRISKAKRMGYWENTTYLGHRDAAVVADTITALFAEEGMRRIGRPSQREPTSREPMQYAGALQNNLRGVAIIPGSGEWTIIKTAPLELLGERAPGGSRMRIVDLAARLAVAGFQLNVHDGSDAVMVEADGRGRYLLSGFTGCGEDPDDPLQFHEDRVAEDRITVRFDLLPLQAHVRASQHRGSELIDYQMLAARLAAALAGGNSPWCNNMTCLNVLIGHKPLPISGAFCLYFEWPARDRSG